MMNSKKVWEYSIGVERSTGLYESWNIICELNPVEGWSTVFKTLSDRGDLRDVKKIGYANCMEKELLFIQ